MFSVFLTSSPTKPDMVRYPLRTKALPSRCFQPKRAPCPGGILKHKARRQALQKAAFGGEGSPQLYSSPVRLWPFGQEELWWRVTEPCKFTSVSGAARLGTFPGQGQRDGYAQESAGQLGARGEPSPPSLPEPSTHKVQLPCTTASSTDDCKHPEGSVFIPSVYCYICNARLCKTGILSPRRKQNK